MGDDNDIEDHDRRAADRAEQRAILEQQQKIDDLILLEDDPKQRLFLMVMASINKSIHANTVITQDTSAKLNAHVAKSAIRHREFIAHTIADAEATNKAKGLWLLVPRLLVVVQLVVAFVFTQVLSDLRAIHTQLNSQNIVAVQNSDRIKTLEDARR